MPKRYITAYNVLEGGLWVKPITSIQVPNAKELRKLKREARDKDRRQIELGSIFMHAFRTVSCVKDVGPEVTWDTVNGWRHRIRIRRTGAIGRIAQEHNWDIRRLKGIQTTLRHILLKYTHSNYESVEGLERFLGDIEEKIIIHRKRAIEQERQRCSTAGQRPTDTRSTTGSTS